MNKSAVWMTCSLSLAAVTMMTPWANAQEKREPIKPALEDGKRPPLQEAKLHTTELRLDRYNKVEKVVRMRTPGKVFASFSADPVLIDAGAVMLFEIRSVSPKGGVPRWRCIAVHDVAECLGAPVKVRWLEGEDRMVLTATAKPATEMGLDAPLASN